MHTTQKTQKKPTEESFMEKNFLLISLEEKKAKKIAEVISNETCRKILDALSKKEYTETQLSEELKVPISTVHYNLKQLQEANLVIVDEFHYSKKGKEINHYKLANKYIIIAPKNDDSGFMDALKKIIPITIISVVVAGIIHIFSKITTKSAATASDMIYSESTPKLMTASAKMAPQVAPEIVRPALQSSPVAIFLIGMAGVIIAYFLYELVKKK